MTLRPISDLRVAFKESIRAARRGTPDGQLVVRLKDLVDAALAIPAYRLALESMATRPYVRNAVDNDHVYQGIAVLQTLAGIAEVPLSDADLEDAILSRIEASKGKRSVEHWTWLSAMGAGFDTRSVLTYLNREDMLELLDAAAQLADSPISTIDDVLEYAATIGDTPQERLTTEELFDPERVARVRLIAHLEVNEILENIELLARLDEMSLDVWLLPILNGRGGAGQNALRIMSAAKAARG